MHKSVLHGQQLVMLTSHPDLAWSEAKRASAMAAPAGLPAHAVSNQS